MPTHNPRVAVTLSPSLDALVSALADLQHASKSQVLRELLEAAEPALRRAVVLMDAASKATADVHQNLARALGQAQDRAEASLAQSLADADAMADDLVTQAEAVRARRPGRGAAGARVARAGGVSAGVAPSPAAEGNPDAAEKRPRP